MSFLNQLLEEAQKDKEVGRFPFSVGVEVTNFCNLRCPMCPREIADRGYGNMTWELFTKIADEAAEHPYRLFQPQGFGESFIHPRYRDMLRYLHKKGVHPTMVITNATLLTDKNIAALIESEVDFVNLSVDGPDKEAFEEIRQNAIYERVVANVKRLFEERERRGAVLPRIIIRMIKMDKTAHLVDEFEAIWRPYLKDGDEIAYSNYQTWAGAVDDHRVEERVGERVAEELGHKPACRMLYKTAQIYYDGRMTPCCYDYNCTMEIGNAKEQSVEEIWTGEKAQHYRRLHEEGRMDEIPICNGCREYIP